ncbi:MAG: hypothetical protein JSV80_12410 [Acidobacteriota bacterium]|nr:MAG: hypothetical protein JSV80_12410 [Acidobacteriota bacterium]
MDSLCAWIAVNACAAVLLALAAALAGRYLKRPGLVHLLWILVLLELLSPPLLEVAVLPRAILPWAEETLEQRAVPPLESLPIEAPGAATAIVAASPAPTSVSFARTLGLTLAVIWAAGAASVLLLAAVRMRRFARCLAHTTEPPPEMPAAAARLAGRLGLKRCPRIRLVPSDVSPMLRPSLGGLELLFPAPLLARLRPGERDTLLAHELAHVRRRDHWVRWLELLAASLFWWHPVVWWARARLRRVEEQCCDALVLKTLPHQAREYAEALVKTVEFLASARRGLPSLASGVGGARILEERLTMIINCRMAKNLTGPQRVAVALAAGALLLVFPTWAERDPDRSAKERDKEEQQLAAREAEIRESMLALEERAQQLEKELQEVRTTQRQLEMGLRQQHQKMQIERLEEEAIARQAAGEMEPAEQLRREQAWLREQMEIENQRMQLEREVERAVRAEKEDMRRAMLEAERNAAREDAVRAQEFHRQARDSEIRLKLLEREARERQRALERRMTARDLDRIRAQIEMLEHAGRHDEARDLAVELELRRRELDEERSAHWQEDHLRALQREIERLTIELERAEAAGRHDQADELAQQINDLLEDIDREDDSR